MFIVKRSQLTEHLKYFYQLISFHFNIVDVSAWIRSVVYGSCHRRFLCNSLCLCLSPTKHVQGHFHVFQAIQTHIPNWGPERIMCDFELSEIFAVRQVFPQANITGNFG